MNRAFPTLIACSLLLSFAWPQAEAPVALGPDDSKLICDIVRVMECWPDGDCSAGTPESVDLPHFIQLDLDAKSIGSPSPGFDAGSATVDSVDRTDGRIALTGGGREGRIWSLLISEQTGELNGAVLAGGFSLLVYGACILDE